MALRTRSRASTETERGPLLMTYETVDGTTLASLATSFRVTRVLAGVTPLGRPLGGALTFWDTLREHTGNSDRLSSARTGFVHAFL